MEKKNFSPIDIIKRIFQEYNKNLSINCNRHLNVEIDFFEIIIGKRKNFTIHSTEPRIRKLFESLLNRYVFFIGDLWIEEIETSPFQYELKISFVKFYHPPSFVI